MPSPPWSWRAASASSHPVERSRGVVKLQESELQAAKPQEHLVLPHTLSGSWHCRPTWMELDTKQRCVHSLRVRLDVPSPPYRLPPSTPPLTLAFAPRQASMPE